jgi:MFS family permease
MISLKRSMSILCVMGLLKNMLFILPVLMLYYGFKGVSIGEFFLIQGLSSMVVFFTEVPTGYLADIVSRKKTILIGFLIWTIGYLFWIFGYGFWYILIGELIFGLSISFLSGTIEAYMYDLLKKRGKEKAFHKKFAKYNALSNLGLFVATITGSFLYERIGADNTVWLCLLCSFLACVLMCFMPEVEEAKRQVADNKSKIADILEISTNTLKKCEIRWLMVFSAVYGTLTLTMMWGLQAVMMERNVPVYLFGVILGINSFARIIWSFISAKILDKFGAKKILFLLLGIIFIALISALLSIKVRYIFVYVCLCGMIVGSGSILLSRIMIATLINHQTKSDERATVLSVQSMGDKMCSGLGMIALKPLFDNIGIFDTFAITAILLIPVVYSVFILVYKVKIK